MYSRNNWNTSKALAPMDSFEPKFRAKHTASEKKKDKGPIYASKKHVRIELENQYRQEKRMIKNIQK